MNRNRLTFQAVLIAIPLLYSPWGIAQPLSDACRDLAGFNDRGFIIRDALPEQTESGHCSSGKTDISYMQSQLLRRGSVSGDK